MMRRDVPMTDPIAFKASKMGGARHMYALRVLAMMNVWLETNPSPIASLESVRFVTLLNRQRATHLNRFVPKPKTSHSRVEDVMKIENARV